jgi:hypothetical protein
MLVACRADKRGGAGDSPRVIKSVRPPPRSLNHLDVGRPDHLAPFLGFRGDVLGEVDRSHRHQTALLGKPCLHSRIGEGVLLDFRLRVKTSSHSLVG